MSRVRGKQIYDGSIKQDQLGITTDSITTPTKVTNKEFVDISIDSGISNLTYSYSDYNITANSTTGSTPILACTRTITDYPVGGVRVFINGIEVDVGPGKDCYFASGSTGLQSARSIGYEQKGDYLWWNPSVAPYRLDSNDSIDYVYLTYSNIKLNYKTFNLGSGFNNITYEMKYLSDGKIIVVGSQSTYQGTLNDGITKVNADGTIDTSFISGSGFTGGLVRVVDIQTDNKILVGGAFTSYNGYSSSKMIRLNSDGTVDTGFTMGTGFGNSIRAIEVQTDGKIIVGGVFTSYSGQTHQRIIRLYSDGTRDVAFNSGTNGFSGDVYSIMIQTDGKILCGGNFTTYSGITRNYMARLNSDGTLDTSFNSGGTGFGAAVFKIHIQNDGKILCVGNFTTYNGQKYNRLIRLNYDGTVDTDFTMGTGFDDNTRYVTVDSNGKILVTGLFTHYNSIPCNYIVRLNSDGTFDNTFNIGTGFGARTYAVETQTDGKILISGEFTSYDGQSANYFMRLYSNGESDTY